jgi:hypothetical protein
MNARVVHLQAVEETLDHDRRRLCRRCGAVEVEVEVEQDLRLGGNPAGKR